MDYAIKDKENVVIAKLLLDGRNCKNCLTGIGKTCFLCMDAFVQNISVG